MSKIINKVDVICEHKSDGSVIPMRFRIVGESGEYEAYTIRGYRQVYKGKAFTTPDGITICNTTKVFECRVIILDAYRTVRLYFNKDDCSWKMAI